MVALPLGKSVVSSKWVYKIKYRSNEDIERYKAILVEKGYTQSAGIDFHETYAPVVKMVTVGSLLAIFASNNWFLELLDVNYAFFMVI